jgi:hypothetical protein
MSQLRTNSIVPVGGIPAGASGGGVVQIKQVSTNTEITSTNNVPRDSSVPLSTEGVELLSTTFSCLSTSNKVLITVCVYGNENTNAGDNLTFCVYDGSTFIGMGYHAVTGTSTDIENYWNTSFDVLYSPASTSSKTYSLRGGIDNGTYEHLGTTTYAVNSHYGANRRTTMTIYEISG